MEQKSATVRAALRQRIGRAEESAGRPMQTDAGLLAAIDRVVREAVGEAVAGELGELLVRIRAVVDEALAQGKVQAGPDGGEDPELAARLDEQLASFFD